MRPGIKMPVMVAALPRDERGYPVPFFAPYKEGKPVFAVASGDKRRLCAFSMLCWICGQPLISKMAFIGGEGAFKSRTYGDAAMHVECAEYAVQVCPYMVDPRYQKRMAKEGESLPGQIDERPDESVIYVTDGYTILKLKGDEPLNSGTNFLFRPNPPLEIQRWKNGALKS